MTAEAGFRKRRVPGMNFSGYMISRGQNKRQAVSMSLITLIPNASSADLRSRGAAAVCNNYV